MVVVNLTHHKLEEYPKAGWSNQENAEFYRISDIMNTAGLVVEMDSGISDEGDPWLVFVRKDTGDVIAHFARFDGCFVSVSSITSDIYRGNDARSVVDQMLHSHPLMLPKSSSGGKLYLHPSIALTAFVIAAFLMTLDGVKAQSLDDVLAATLTNPQGLPSSSKGEIIKSDSTNVFLRSPFLDLGPMASNLAVIGTALIQQQIFLSLDFNFEAQNASENTNENLTTGTADSLSSPYDIWGSVAAHEDKKNLDGLELNVLDKSIQEVETGGLKGMFSVGFAEMVLSNLIDQMRNSSEENRGDESNVYIDTVDGTQWGDFERVADGLVKRSEGMQSMRETQTGSDYENQLRAVFKELDLLVQSEELALGITNSGLGVAIGKEGQLSFIELDEGSNSNDDGLISLLNPDQQKFQSFNAASSPEDQKVQLPIVGHKLLDDDVSVSLLSDVIDVVFYEGGNSKVENFELGVDLLWFFLAPEVVSNARGEIENETDFLLDFGDIGTLTLINVIESNLSPDYI
jgi:hypothetical protein